MTTTAEKIAVMQAFEDGKEVEFRFCLTDETWRPLKSPNPLWDWLSIDYRIKREPRVRYILESPDGNLDRCAATANEALVVSGRYVKFIEVMEG